MKVVNVLGAAIHTRPLPSEACARLKDTVDDYGIGSGDAAICAEQVLTVMLEQGNPDPEVRRALKLILERCSFGP